MSDEENNDDDLLTQHAIDFIRESKDAPFFCYVPFQIAHAPLQAKEEDLAAIDPGMAAKLPAARPTALASPTSLAHVTAAATIAASPFSSTSASSAAATITTASSCPT